MQAPSFAGIAAVMTLTVHLCCAAMGQISRTPTGSLGGSGTGSTNSNAGTLDSPDRSKMLTPSLDTMIEPESRSMMVRRETARKLERKKRMVDSANRLLALSEQLRTELQTRKATPEDEKRLDEIAKLARLVKDQMRQ